MKNLVLTLLFTLPLLSGPQKENMWNKLSNVTYEIRLDEVTKFDLEFPIFSDEVKALDGKEITIEGWMIPLEELQGKSYFVLSALPFANCFFCGGAGPETVMEVFGKKHIDFTDKKIKVRGKLTINPDDPLRLMYILNEARLVD